MSLLFVLVPLLLIETYINYDGYRSRRAHELESNLEVARAVGKAFEAFVKDIVHQELAIGLAITSPHPMAPEDITRLLGTHSDYAAVRDFFWVDPGGNLLYSSNPCLIGANHGEQAYFQEILRGREWMVGDLVVARTTGKPIFSISRGIRDDNGVLLGVVACTVTPEKLDSVLSVERGKGGGVALMDRKGMLVYRYPAINVSWEERNWLKLYPRTREALDGKEISTAVYSQYEEKRRLIGNVPIPSIGWVAGAGRTEEIAMEAPASIAIYNSILFLAVALTAFVMAFLFSRSISASVKRIRDYALALGGGERLSLTMEHGPSEIKELAEAFGTMAERVIARERALRKSEELLRVTLRSIGDAVITTDTEGRITFINPVASALTGWRAEEAIGRPVENVYRIINEKTREPEEDIVGRVLREGSIVALINSAALVRRDGGEIPVEESAAPIAADSDGAMGVVFVFHDVAQRRRGQEALKESERRYRELVQNANSAIIRWRSDGAIVFFNEYARDFFGYSAEEVIGKDVSILFAPAKSARSHERAQVLDVMTRPEEYGSSIAENVLKDGRKVWMAWSRRPIFDEDGRAQEILAVGSDLTERRRAEQKIQDQNKILETINLILYESLSCRTEEELGQVCLKGLEALTQSEFGFIAEYGPDRSLRDLAISDPGWEACAMLDEGGHRRAPIGFKIHGLYGRVLLDGKSLLTNDPASHPDSIGAPPVHPSLRTFLGAPLTLGGDTIGMIGLGNREGGYEREHLLAVETIAPSVVEALMRKRAEDALSEAQDRMAADLDAMTRLREIGALFVHQGGVRAVLDDVIETAVAVTGADMGNIRILDPQTGRLETVAHHGFEQPFLDSLEGVGEGAGSCDAALASGERLIVEDATQIPKPADMSALDARLAECVRAYQHTPLIGRSGRRLGIFTTYFRNPCRPDDRTLRFLDLLARQTADIIERFQIEEELRRSRDELEERVRERTLALNRVNEELQRSNQALQDFTAIAAHDLHEPLRKVASFGKSLRDKYGLDLGEGGRDYLERMLGAASRMQSLLTSLLEYSRVTAKAEPLREVDLMEIVNEVLSDLEVRILQTRAEVQVDHLPVIVADPTQMRQLFQNLIGNALKFHKKGEKPVIRVWSDSTGEGGTQIFVEDNGVGFDEQGVDRIFSPFERLHGRHEYQGTGMGLAICRKITERHGGTITAKSSPGAGSSFVVTIPVDKR